ncbi:isopentenyl pyrophosphate isomerase [Pyrodictium delaneyi]|uniref:Isopentenyl-diphosphate delta-isomerase n=1 Tax=Pyrodictium delaneyi TaxID=1273541 RepID=A0A0N7JDF7_9CREN|nr:type 2 isopentenyl-diphosphate Delta-isomerase [Pyrodictium delaneyi]ALL02065.1 isopentenyl pyrophosphate isomerase [Pyrodictium delaneyi]OWJ54778.1 type 2 isopentenyl-diphosphate Delta-isomerase [Pyrodictium delaneyi]
MATTSPRKLDHIRITVDSRVDHDWTSALLDDVVLVYKALPETSLNDIDTSIEFLGKRLSAPIMVTGMTGGHAVAAEINCAIAKAVEELGLMMGVGSQRAAIENPNLAYTFSIVRKCAPSAVIVANIGAPQLVKGYGIKELTKAIEMIDADAVAIHLNAAQEAFQPEGDTDYVGVVDKIRELADVLGKPIIVKETGHGIGLEAATLLRAVGIKIIDVAGAGGTSWVKVEQYRARAKGDELLAAAASTFSGFGVPTAQAIVETRWAAPDACIIASGGIRSGLDVAKAIALGADVAGLALPVINAYVQGGGHAILNLLKRMIMELRIAMFLTGSKDLAELRSTNIILGQRLLSLMEARGISAELYLNGPRLLFKLGSGCSPTP